MISVKFHIIWVETALIVRGRRRLGGRLREVRGVLRTDGWQWLAHGLCDHSWMGLAILIDDEDVDLLKVLYEAMQVVYLEAAAGVVLTQFVLAIEGAECGAKDGTSVALYGRGHLFAPEVAGIEWAEKLTGRATGVESAAK